MKAKGIPPVPVACVIPVHWLCQRIHQLYSTIGDHDIANAVCGLVGVLQHVLPRWRQQLRVRGEPCSGSYVFV